MREMGQSETALDGGRLPGTSAAIRGSWLSPTRSHKSLILPAATGQFPSPSGSHAYPTPWAKSPLSLPSNGVAQRRRKRRSPRTPPGTRPSMIGTSQGTP